MSGCDVIVLGAGPAGASAAIEASKAGLDVVVLDANPAAGGQVYRAPPGTFKVTDAEAMGPDFAIGDALRQELAASPAKCFFGRTVWHIGPGFVIRAVFEGNTEVYEAPTLIVAMGTHERVIPMPGWTLPGVMGLAAATILLKSQRILPGENTVVAGSGPLLAAVAASISKGGGKVAALVELSTRMDWVKAMPSLLSRPDLLKRGFVWLGELRAAGVPIYRGHAVTAIQGDGEVNGVEIAPVDAQWRPTSGERRRIAADSVTIGHGLVPSTEVTRLLGARHAYRSEQGGWVALRNRDFETTVPNVFVAGDGAGIAGAAAAALRGRLAGLAVARRAGRTIDTGREGILLEQLGKAERFGHAISDLMRPRAGLTETITPETIVCRCEEVSRADLDAAIRDGARDVNQMKAWTRCGMGPCQGRMCGEAAASLLAAAQDGDRSKVGQLTARPPLRPIPYEAIVGQFDYATMELPEPQPG